MSSVSSLPQSGNRGAVSELRDYVGVALWLVVDNLRVPVQCIDARSVWQRIDVLVTPIGGEGEQWVSTSRLRSKGGAA